MYNPNAELPTLQLKEIKYLIEIKKEKIDIDNSMKIGYHRQEKIINYVDGWYFKIPGNFVFINDNYGLI